MKIRPHILAAVDPACYELITEGFGLAICITGCPIACDSDFNPS